MSKKIDLLVSFSGGETSALMTLLLVKSYSHHYNIVVAFANTGLEHPKTYEFVKRFSDHFGIEVHWIEAKVNPQKGKRTTYTETNYREASREGEPFEQVIAKYGLPNSGYMHCTRELKAQPIKVFAQDYFGHKKYYTAIGIRADEFDRMSAKRKQFRYIYPLIEFEETTKGMVNSFWSRQPFRLDIPSYLGNCITCFKKSDNRLLTILKESPSSFDFFKRMEETYGHIKTKQSYDDRKLFRRYRSVADLVEEAKNFTGTIKNDREELESCEVFGHCGD